MFDGADYPKSLNESIFENWLEIGRASKIGYHYMLILWDAFEENYRAIFLEDRESIKNYGLYPGANGTESLIAAYDLYSESRIGLQ